MNARQLEVFRAIMRDNSVTAAANSLAVSQPAVSKVLHHLESQLGYKLFERIGGRLVPTMEAHLLYEDADRVFRELEVLKNIARSIGERKIGLLRIGASAPITYSILTEALLDFRKQHPTVKIHLTTVPKVEISELLLLGEIDLAFTMSSIQAPTVRCEPLSNVRVVVVVKESDPLAAKHEVTPHDLVGRPLISYDKRSDVGPDLDEAFERCGLIRDTSVQVSSSIGAAPLVAGGLGVALVDGLIRWNLFQGLRAIPFTPAVYMTLSSSVNSTRPISRFYRPFLASIRPLL